MPKWNGSGTLVSGLTNIPEAPPGVPEEGGDEEPPPEDDDPPGVVDVDDDVWPANIFSMASLNFSICRNKQSQLKGYVLFCSCIFFKSWKNPPKLKPEIRENDCNVVFSVSLSVEAAKGSSSLSSSSSKPAQNSTSNQGCVKFPATWYSFPSPFFKCWFWLTLYSYPSIFFKYWFSFPKFPSSSPFPHLIFFPTA